MIPNGYAICGFRIWAEKEEIKFIDLKIWPCPF
jgi:hypothetical protein